MGVRGYDVVVAGGGPAGSTCAILAARQGMRVLLLERGLLPRHKVCGEFVSAEGVKLLREMTRQDEAAEALLREAVRIAQVRLVAGGREARAAIAPAAASIARHDLDAVLWRLAQAAGADCRQQVEVQSIAPSEEGFTAKTSAGKFHARLAVNGAGRWSRLKSPPGPGKEAWLGVKAHFLATEAQDQVELHFFEGGYCGVQPVRMERGELRLNVCAMVSVDAASTMEQVLARAPELWRRSRDWEQVTDTLTTSPLRFDEPAPLMDGVLQTGDAAGFIDPFLGDGISLALHSGRMAAESLAVGGEAAERYRTQYERELLPAFGRARRLRIALRFPAAAVELLQVPGVAEYVVRRTRVG